MSNCKVALLGAAFGMLMTDGSFAQQTDGKPAANPPVAVRVDERGTVHISELEVPVSSFYEKIKSPVLVDIALEFDRGLGVTQRYPRDLPDLFKGNQLTVFGRYGGTGSNVTLTGTVASGTEKDLSGRIARNTNDVVSVNNQLAVSGKPGTTAKAKDEIKTAARDTKETLSDGWITTKVKSSLMLTRDVEGRDISVTTNNGVVKLAGNVDSKVARERAIEVAQNVRGVKKVDPSGIKVE